MTTPIQHLFATGVLTLAEQPKNNHLDITKIDGIKLLLLPIDHDYPGGSAAMHNAVFEKFDLPYRSAFVVADPANAEKIAQAFRDDPHYIGGGSGSGFKDKIIEFLDDTDESAKVIGSVNVITKTDGKLIGYNTDGVGFRNGLVAEYPDAVKGNKVVILGGGGTALPIAYELAREAREIVVLNRTVSKAERIAKLVEPFTKSRFGGEDQIGAELKDADLVINTTNKGAQPYEKWSAFGPMSRKEETLAADTKIARDNLSGLPKNAIVADILLEDMPRTLAMAKENGHRTHAGTSMNLHQAIPAFKIMTKLNDYEDAALEALMRGTQ